MFVRAKRRFKDGKEHRYWSVVENCRNRDGRVVQRQVLYLGEINDSQRAREVQRVEIEFDIEGDDHDEGRRTDGAFRQESWRTLPRW